MFRLAENLNKTVTEIVTGQPGPMSLLEFNLWAAYRQRRGFTTDRLEWATANAGSAVSQTWGGKVKPSDIVPKFGSGGGKSVKSIALAIASMPGAKVRFIPKDRAARPLQGREALQELERQTNAELEAKSPRALNARKTDERQEVKKTL